MFKIVYQRYGLSPEKKLNFSAILTRPNRTFFLCGSYNRLFTRQSSYIGQKIVTISPKKIFVNPINSPDQLETAFIIRRKVFVEEQEVEPEIEYDEFESSSIHYLARLNGVAVGTARWRWIGKSVKLERFAVLKEYRGQGIGDAILSKVLADVIPLAPEKIYLHAQVQVIPFYEKHGFRKTGPEFVEANIRHFKMVL